MSRDTLVNPLLFGDTVATPLPAPGPSLSVTYYLNGPKEWGRGVIMLKDNECCVAASTFTKFALALTSFARVIKFAWHATTKSE